MRAMVLGAYFLFTVLMVLYRVYFPTLPACSTAMRPIEVNRVGDIRVVRLNISSEAAPRSPERAVVSLACRGRYATERQTNPSAIHHAVAFAVAEDTVSIADGGLAEVRPL
jgi:hypothetical protein